MWCGAIFCLIPNHAAASSTQQIYRVREQQALTDILVCVCVPTFAVCTEKPILWRVDGSNRHHSIHLFSRAVCGAGLKMSHSARSQCSGLCGTAGFSFGGCFGHEGELWGVSDKLVSNPFNWVRLQLARHTHAGGRERADCMWINFLWSLYPTGTVADLVANYLRQLLAAILFFLVLILTRLIPFQMAN